MCVSWVKLGDESDMNPRLMALAECEGVDSRTINEVHGFIMRCAAYSARQLTDSFIDLGAIFTYGTSEVDRLVRLCLEVGLLEQVEVDGKKKLKLVEDNDYVNVLTREEVEHSRQQNRDNRDPMIKGPVLVRDGDNCRWCDTPVYWHGKPSARKGTLDHLEPGKPGTVDTMVVACWSCNSARKRDESGTWAKEHELLPPPERPRYGKATTKYLERLGLIMPPAPACESSAGTESASTSDTSSVDVVPGLDGAGSGVEGSADSGRSPADVDLLAADHRRSEDPSAVEDSESASGGAGGVNEPDSESISNSIRYDIDMPTPANSNSPGRVGTGRVESGRAGEGSGRAGSAREGPGSGRAGPGRPPRRRTRRRKKRNKRKDDE